MNALQLRDVTLWSSTTINAGQTWKLGFKSIPFFTLYNSDPSIVGNNTVTFWNFGAPSPATFTLELFANTLSDPPLTFSLTNTDQFAFGATAKNIWTDHQGWIRLHVLTG